MAVKKTALYSSLWARCDELRGGMDASQYKDYVLTLLFMKYVSDKLRICMSAQQAAWLILQRTETRTTEEDTLIERLAQQPELSGAVTLALRFIDLVRQRLPS